MLALSFLVLIGIVLIAEGVATTIDRGYIYVAMVFALLVEILNKRAHRRHPHARHPHVPEAKSELPSSKSVPIVSG